MNGGEKAGISARERIAGEQLEGYWGRVRFWDGGSHLTPGQRFLIVYFKAWSCCPSLAAAAPRPSQACHCPFTSPGEDSLRGPPTAPYTSRGTPHPQSPYLPPHQPQGFSAFVPPQATCKPPHPHQCPGQPAEHVDSCLWQPCGLPAGSVQMPGFQSSGPAPTAAPQSLVIEPAPY